jgi:hypothetical protein
LKSSPELHFAVDVGYTSLCIGFSLEGKKLQVRFHGRGRGERHLYFEFLSINAACEAD